MYYGPKNAIKGNLTIGGTKHERIRSRYPFWMQQEIFSKCNQKLHTTVPVRPSLLNTHAPDNTSDVKTNEDYDCDYAVCPEWQLLNLEESSMPKALKPPQKVHQVLASPVVVPVWPGS
jgi:hypothetical protein